MDIADKEHLQTLAQHYRRRAGTERRPDVARVLNQIAEEYEIAVEAYAPEDEPAGGPDPPRHLELTRNEKGPCRKRLGRRSTHHGQQKMRPHRGTDGGAV